MEKENYTIEYINDIEGTDEYQEFINDLDKQDILIGRITDIETL